MREEWLRHGCRFGGRQPCAVILQLRRITRMCMRYLVDFCVVLNVLSINQSINTILSCAQKLTKELAKFVCRT